jgi:hypothetical protein
MSAAGQTAISADASPKSALPLKGDIAQNGRHVRKVPISDINDEPTIELTYDRLSDFSRLDDCVRDSL